MNVVELVRAATSQDVQVGNPNSAFLMLFAFTVLLVIVWANITRAVALRKLGSMIPPSRLSMLSRKRIFSSVLLVAATCALAIALMDIRWGKASYDVPQKGLEVVFALDISRSMLAEDATPNRLARAKQQINDMVAEMAGDRIGLVVFAGEAKQVVPLTSHYDDFEQVLESVGPDTLTVGGSQLGGAIRTAAESFMSKTNDHKTIILFTDGEDQESKPAELAMRLYADEGIRVFTVGLGDMDQGSRIPDNLSRRRTFIEHQGQQVWTKLNGQILNQIATVTNAAYIPAGTKRVNMADVYHGYVANVEKTQFETAKVNAYIPRFQWFAGFALICILTEVFASTGRTISSVDRTRSELGANLKNANVVKNAPSHSLDTKIGAAAIVVFAFLMPFPQQQANSTEEKINNANRLVRAQKATEAIDAFREIGLIEESENESHLDYNLAVAHYRNSDLDAAIKLFNESAKSPNDVIAANSRYNLGNCRYALALKSIQEQPADAVGNLEKAIVHYRSALRLDRSNSDARTNIELAKKLIDQINDQQKQQESERKQEQSPQQNEQQEKQQQQKEQEEQSQDSQSEDQSSQDRQSQQDPTEQEKADQNASEDPSDSESESNNESQSEEQRKSQEGQKPSQDSTDAEDGSDSQSQQGDDRRTESEQNNKKRNDRSNSPKESQAANEEGDSGQNQEKQSGVESGEKEVDANPDGELTAANDAIEKDADSAKRKAVLPRDRDGLMTREEALKLLQAVRDRDMLRRLQQRRRQRSRRSRVEKDW